MGAKNWTEEEYNFLEDKWGIVSIPTIAKSLGRTEDAVKLKAYKLGMRRHIHACEEITINQLIKALGGHYQYTVDRWIKHGFPVKYKKSVRKKYKVFKLEDFWKWAEQHKDILDRLKRTGGAIKRRMVDLGLKQRPLKADNHTPWTNDEIKMLLNLRHKGFGPEAIANKLEGKRSSLAVRGKLERMGLIGGNGQSRRNVSSRC